MVDFTGNLYRVDTAKINRDAAKSRTVKREDVGLLLADELQNTLVTLGISPSERAFDYLRMAVPLSIGGVALRKVYGLVGLACWVSGDTVYRIIYRALEVAYDGHEAAWAKVYPPRTAPNTKDAIAYIARAVYGV
ncbi:MAG: hypothetical protein LBT36_00820 [Oscillospiraceae bacterium]|jgi:hypothetical protein|nr:hypothetical protein [Oscillospiraceae bacterium]